MVTKSIRIKKSIFWDDIEVDYTTGLENIPQELKKAARGVLDLLAEHPDGLVVIQIKKSVTGGSAQIDEALKALLNDNQVYREGAGIKTDPFVYKFTKKEESK